ncbi:MAG: Vitamin K epoxide reductase [Candidatus Nomurabacteria bacterium GW2011_GWF2_35_66]|uniref:Vitamin K epoxide reductase n=1 Tax=Candidatus Nomurabacteria bacterium GW2011_GWE1_35_16 TaxID=1618761 RepID=A0A0G0B9J7_9BACT|nr:MAG: Vitamin K epoxide reductase [Candidatus Nomurabacteria bacterium GW2011_GWF1_34_20]KKP62098.1 MAG: Vitamin K epoxide reductase [Candidatus Nomurabacteria bacterium GW2011_GWE2_34_25]KKP66064.1 MAG: Vitamin K epoxide reductase [Candidatus Nomurabacteria bacterium GW2011_GWE1_35_16]KKP83030.1 MAG: Vitamin K epoxide reductase [Candidatus Nomurabacteria bacterium GW2011_GWF2_35_66]HAE36973.1 hypothetical protein [Candidatus Nomurabacteria bacterium]
MKTKFFVVFIVVTVIVVGGLGVFVNRDTSGPSKYDGLAKALKDKGAEFYGAFWCPHCQEQKAEFGTSKKYLPYIECANTDNTVKQICIDEKIEGYPTWRFKDGITINSEKEPLICEIKTDKNVGPEFCKDRSSQYYRTWIFPDYGFSVRSPIDPIKDGIIWKFPSGAEASGKMPLSSLAEQIQFSLPQ